MRSMLVFAVLSAVGCQCFVPVSEDGGASGGGVAGGGAAGGGVAGGGVAGGGVTGGGVAGGVTGGGVTGGGVAGGGVTGGGVTGGGVAGGGVTGGGVTGGGVTGGGVTGGGSARCAQASDCAGRDAGSSDAFCATAPGRGWSCVLGRCVYECAGGRLCDATTPMCLTCGSQTSCLNQMTCPLLTHLTFERSTCGVSQFEMWRTRPLSSGPCQAELLFPDGGVAGTLWAYGYGSVRADIPSWGGTCVGVDQQTGAVRFSLSCPACLSVVRPDIVGP